jgi:hypothetical protein
MKEKYMKSTPQKQTFVMYAEREDGTYGSIETGSYLIENDLDDFWKKMEHRERSMREKLVRSEISPVHYYMVIEELTVQELSQRTRFAPSKVKKHMTMKGFEKTSVRELMKYADVFNIPVCNLFQMVLSSKGQNIKYHFYNKDEDRSEQTTITQEKTSNPVVVIAKVEELKK